MTKYTYNLKVITASFDCCGSATISHFYSETMNQQPFKSDEEPIEKLKAAELILTRDRRNLGIAVITAAQAKLWGKYMVARGWVKVGVSVQNQKTTNMLEVWMLDMVNRKVVDISPPPAPPVNGFDIGGARLDRRDEARSAEIIGRSTIGEAGRIKDHFMDINNHRVMFVDLPVFNRGALLDGQLTFSSIRLVNGGGSYSWLQGGTHRFPAPVVNVNGTPVDDDDDEDEDEDDDDF